MRVTWSREAHERLFEIEEFIARDSPERAIHFVDSLIHHVETMLTTNPKSGRMVPEVGNPRIRELIYRGYRVVYQLGETHLVILTVFEGHRLLRVREIKR